LTIKKQWRRFLILIKNKEMNELLDILKTIPDPEIPVIDIVELGIVREARCLMKMLVK
jgi:ring-1,2-phenylacetyl-CoA epoxidase subunit PaaD